MTAPCGPYAADYDPEIATLHADITEIAQERDQYASDAEALRRAVADSHAREAFLGDTIAQLRTALAAAEQRAARLAAALTEACLPVPIEAVPLALTA
ncbi:MAG: hypothetical protein ACRDRL_09640 [Sciscionella sp.]